MAVETALVSARNSGMMYGAYSWTTWRGDGAQPQAGIQAFNLISPFLCSSSSCPCLLDRCRSGRSLHELGKWSPDEAVSREPKPAGERRSGWSPQVILDLHRRFLRDILHMCLEPAIAELADHALQLAQPLFRRISQPGAEVEGVVTEGREKSSCTGHDGWLDWLRYAEKEL